MSTWLTNVRLEVSEQVSQVSQVSEDGHVQTLKKLYNQGKLQECVDF